MTKRVQDYILQWKAYIDAKAIGILTQVDNYTVDIVQVIKENEDPIKLDVELAEEFPELIKLSNADEMDFTQEVTYPSPSSY